MSTEVGYTPSGNRVTLEIEPRVEGHGPHVFVYSKDGKRYRVQVERRRTPRQVADDLVSGAQSDRWINEQSAQTE